MKYISVVISFFFTGCAFTSSQVAQEVNKRQQEQYNQYVRAKAESVKAVMDALAKIDRGGMKIELTPDGRIKAIQYTERLDTEILKQALVTAQPKMYVPKSGLEEFGDFFLKFGSFATPVASLWLNYKTTKSNNWARVEITKSNNEAQANMYNAFTSNFKNETIVTTTTNNTSVNTSSDKTVEKETVVSNTSKEVENNTNSVKEISSINNTKEVTNNNNNGGNQNIGETNQIIPQYLINNN